MSLEEVESRYIAAVLEKHQGNITKTSEVLGISYSTLVRKMKLYGLNNGCPK